jgi:hypothetical protein
MKVSGLRASPKSIEEGGKNDPKVLTTDGRFRIIEKKADLKCRDTDQTVPVT